MALDSSKLGRAVGDFMARHRTSFNQVARRDSQILEIGALCIATRHYESAGYTVSVQRPRDGVFRVNTTARGRPWNFSYFSIVNNSHEYEIYANLAVQSAYGLDEGQYVVDVAVVKGGTVPTRKPQAPWVGTRNDDLVTFLEAKAIVIYPMLIAQFVGIVHEIKPRFLGGRRPRGFLVQRHLDPTLVSLGYTHGISAKIINKFVDRRFHIGVLGHFDAAIRRVAADPFDSPFARATV